MSGWALERAVGLEGSEGVGLVLREGDHVPREGRSGKYERRGGEVDGEEGDVEREGTASAEGTRSAGVEMMGSAVRSLGRRRRKGRLMLGRR